MTPESPLVEMRNLRVSFRVGDGEVEAVRGINLDIRRGEVLGVIGESGSGKTVSMTGSCGSSPITSASPRTC